MNPMKLFFLFPIFIPIAVQSVPTTTIAIGYDGGSLGIDSKITIAMEDKIIAEMQKLLPASKSYVNLPCYPATGSPKKICVEFSETMATKAGQNMGYTIYSPPSLLAGIVKSKVQAWVSKQVAANPNMPSYAVGEA
jgi:hypothetical protein